MDGMKKRNETAPRARGGVTIICFLTIIIGQAYLLRNIFWPDFSAFTALPWGVELLFMLLFVAAIIYLFIRPMGWYTKIRLAVVFSLLIAYIGVNILFYSEFQHAYLTGFSPEYASGAGGLVGLKLVLAVIGGTAGIPVVQSIDGREYARRLREKVEKNNAQLAKEAAAGAQKDFTATVKKLKETLSPEEMEAFLRELKTSAGGADSRISAADKSGRHVSGAGDRTADGNSGNGSFAANESFAEKWRGWGV